MKSPKKDIVKLLGNSCMPEEEVSKLLALIEEDRKRGAVDFYLLMQNLYLSPHLHLTKEYIEQNYNFNYELEKNENN